MKVRVRPAVSALLLLSALLGLLAAFMLTDLLLRSFLKASHNVECNEGAPDEQRYSAVVKAGHWYCADPEVWAVVQEQKTNVSGFSLIGMDWHENRYPELEDGKVKLHD